VQRFVLTSQEKRVLIFVVASFVLGLGAKHYRASHPVATPVAHQSGGASTSHKVADKSR